MKPIQSLCSAKCGFLTFSLLLLSLTVYAATTDKPVVPTGKPSVPAGKPIASDGAEWKVAKQIDAIVQPRFLQKAGQFGMERIETSPTIDGHPNVDVFSEESRSERRRLNNILAMKRPFVVAILHCAHKPGAHEGRHDRDVSMRHFRPTTQPLASAGTTERQAIRNWDWATKHLDRVAVPYTKRLRDGESVDTTYGKWAIQMRPIRAARGACLTCHVGAKRGEPLGAMIYMVQQTPSKVNPDHYWTGSND